MFDVIIVTHQSPILDEKNESRYFSEISSEDFSELVKKFVNVFRSSKKLALFFLRRGACRELEDVDRIICVLEVLADAVSITFRRLFITPLTPPVKNLKKQYSHQIMSTPQDIFYLWVLSRKIPELLELFDKIFVDHNIVVKLVDHLKTGVEEALKEFKLFRENVKEDILEKLRLLLDLPADIRPGCSISKLIPHLLTVSSIASVMYISKYCLNGVEKCDKKHKLELVLLRLAALLHDIGKPVAWLHMTKNRKIYNHARISVTLLDKIKFIDSDMINNYNLGEAYEVLKKIILYHHSKHEIEKINIYGFEISLKKIIEMLKKGDKISSNMDRLGKYFAGLVEDLLKDYAEKKQLTVEEMFVKSGRKVYEAWFSLPQELFRKIVERITNNINSRKIPIELLNQSKIVSNLKVLAFDIAGIQSFIRRESLRSLIAASYIVDLVTTYVLPRTVLEILKLPVESIIYAGGGFVVVLVPSWIDDSGLEKIKNRTREIIGSEISLMFTHAVVDAAHSWPYTARQLAAALSTHKIIFNNSSFNDIITGYEVLCEWCGKKIAVRKTIRGEYVCDECSKLFDIGRNLFVRTKLEILKRSGYEEAEKLINRINELYEHLLEWISGVKLDEAYVKMYKVAVVKADGNVVGQYMASAMNLSEAMLRSIRIDLGLKSGIIYALNKLLQKLDKKKNDIDRNKFEELEEDIARIYVGLLYVGGDDMLAIWPSHLSIPIALAVSTMFWIVNGGAIQLSFSIASAKPKHNIWNMLDVVELLLNECKNTYRTLASFNSINSSDIVAVFSFVRGLHQLFKAEVEHIFSEYRKKGFLYQPLVLAVGKTSQSIGCRNLLKIVSGITSDKEENILSLKDLDEFLDEMFELVFTDKQRKISRAIHEVFEITQAYGLNKAILSLYLARNSLRTSEEFMKILFKKLASLCIECDQIQRGTGLAPFVDLYYIAEIYERR